MIKVGIVNYNMGNLASVVNALDKIGYASKVLTQPCEFKECDKVILPGVGAFPDAMVHLKQNALDEAIIEFAKIRPILGICLGMQLLFETSYEHGKTSGLGLIAGEVLKFEEEVSGKIPQMGWNKINIMQSSPIFNRINNGSYLYFLHSYYAKPSRQEDVLASTSYGVEFASIVNKDNIYGIQPHPEKSGDTGLLLLKNFLEIK